MLNRIQHTGGCNPIRSVLYALLVAAASPAFCQWAAVPSGTTSYLKDIFFLNDSEGYCVGGGDMYGYPNDEQAVVLRTHDGGATWSTVLQHAGVAFTAVAAKGDTVLCFGRSMATTGLVWTSNDGGTTWNADTLTWLTHDVVKPAFHGSDLLFLAGQDLLKLDLDTHLPQTLFIANNAGLYGLDGNDVYVFSVDRHLHKSADGGSTWVPIPCLFDSPGPWQGEILQELFCAGDTIVISVAYNPTIVYTTDRALHWTWHERAIGPNPVHVSLDTVYSYSNTGEISVSTDLGISSEVQYSQAFPIGRLFFLPGSGQGWACGKNGSILKTQNRGFATGVAERKMTTELITLRPNPTHDQVSLMVPNDLRVERLELVDSALKHVRAFPASSRELPLPGIPAGTYWLRVETNRGHQDVRLVVTP